MKRVLIVLVVIFVMLATLLAVDIYYDRQSKSHRVEVYECLDKQTQNMLTINYNEDDSISFHIYNKDDGVNLGFGCGADYQGDNLWIYDGSLSLPESSLYYRFIFNDEDEIKTLDLYNHDELVGHYTLIAAASLSQ